MEVSTESKENIILHQASYAYGLLDRFQEDLQGKKMSTTPAVHETFGTETPTPSAELTKQDYVYLKKTQRILGAILWLVTRTRPDLAYAHSRAASYTLNQPYLAYQKSILILRYLAAFPTLGLGYEMLTTDDPIVTIFGDCSFAPTGKASHEGNVVYVGKSLIGWRSKKQSLVAMSSCEGELVAASYSLILGRCLRLLIAEFVGTEEVKVVIKVDNQAAIAQIKQGEFAPWRTRHISIRGMALSHALKLGEIQLDFCPTDDMSADGLTKALTPQILLRMRELWHMEDAP